MKNILFALAAAAVAAPGFGASLTLSGLADTEDGLVADIDGHLPLGNSWSVAAGAGHAESSAGDEKFSATSLRASTKVRWGALFASAGGERWKDTGQLGATTMRGELGWMSAAGISISALATRRDLDITYTAVLDDVTREIDIEMQGTGFGADLSYFGTAWSAGLRYLDYSYGRNVQRIRAVLDSDNTLRFPRVQRLAESVATRAGSAPDRDLSLMLGRQFVRTSLLGDVRMLRDALTGDETWSMGLTLGLRMGRNMALDTSVGFADGAAAGTVAWGGIALTLLAYR